MKVVFFDVEHYEEEYLHKQRFHYKFVANYEN